MKKIFFFIASAIALFLPFSFVRLDSPEEEIIIVFSFFFGVSFGLFIAGILAHTPGKATTILLQKKRVVKLLATILDGKGRVLTVLVQDVVNPKIIRLINLSDGGQPCLTVGRNYRIDKTNSILIEVN